MYSEGVVKIAEPLTKWNFDLINVGVDPCQIDEMHMHAICIDISDLRVTCYYLVKDRFVIKRSTDLNEIINEIRKIEFKEGF